MQRIALLIMLFVLFAFSALAQEDADPPAEEVEQVDAEETAAEEDEADEPIVDDEFYQDVDDEDFRPSEDIPADQSIPYPTDI